VLIAFFVLLGAGIYLEKVDWREAAVWTFVAAFLGWAFFRRQGVLAMHLGVGAVSVVMALRMFGGMVVPRSSDP
jgi:hypothetical protein